MITLSYKKDSLKNMRSGLRLKLSSLTGCLLPPDVVVRLLAAPPPAKITETKPLKPVVALPIKAKEIPAPLSEAQLRDRREMLRRQLAALAKHREMQEVRP